MKLIHDFIADDSGATTVEYGILAALVGVVVTPILFIIGVGVCIAHWW